LALTRAHRSEHGLEDICFSKAQTIAMIDRSNRLNRVIVIGFVSEVEKGLLSDVVLLASPVGLYDG